MDDPNNYNPKQFFPLKYVFNSPKYRQVTRDIDEELANQIDDLVDKFTKSRIPIERFETENKRNVATVFERVNRRKIDLDIFDLLSVWNWSEEFSLKEKFKDMSNKLNEFGFKGISDDLLLKCSSAVIMNTCKSEAFLDIPGNELSEKCHEIETGLDKAIDFLKSEFNIFSLKLLPMENILVVLTSFFASKQKQPPPVPENQIKAIKQWFWRSCFTERYAKGSTKSTDIDLSELCKLKKGENNKLGQFNYSINQHYFLDNNFRLSSVKTTTFILLLAQNNPLNFIQGTKISLGKVLSIGDRNEFHHIYPKDYLQKLNKEKINCFANFTFLSRTDNNKIKNKPPSKYKLLMPRDEVTFKNILKTHFCTIEMFDDNYDNFLHLRTQLLLEKAHELCS